MTSIPKNPVSENTQTTFLTHFASGHRDLHPILHNPLGLDIELDPWTLKNGSRVEHLFHAMLNPQGYCPLRMDSRRNGFLYISRAVNGPYPGAYKIGMTQADPYKRAGQCGDRWGIRVRRVWLIQLPGMDRTSTRCAEWTLHAHFQGKQLPLGWEWFALDDSDLELIKSIPGGLPFERRRKQR